jgi:hypothetical protein
VVYRTLVAGSVYTIDPKYQIAAEEGKAAKVR